MKFTVLAIAISITLLSILSLVSAQAFYYPVFSNQPGVVYDSRNSPTPIMSDTYYNYEAAYSIQFNNGCPIFKNLLINRVRPEVNYIQSDVFVGCDSCTRGGYGPIVETLYSSRSRF